MNLRTKDDFESYQEWQQLRSDETEYRNQIKEYKSRLNELTDKLPQLRKASKRAYDKSEGNISEINSTDKALEDCKAEIKENKKAWAEAEENLKQHRIKTQEAKLNFLKDAAKYTEELLSEFLPMVDKVAAYYNNVQHFTQFNDLRIPGIDSEFPIYWGIKRRDNLLDGFKQRYEDLQNGFETRELKQLKNDN